MVASVLRPSGGLQTDQYILIRLGLIPNRDISPIPDTRKIFDYLELSIKNCIFALENR